MGDIPTHNAVFVLLIVLALVILLPIVIEHVPVPARVPVQQKTGREKRSLVARLPSSQAAKLDCLLIKDRHA